MKRNLNGVGGSRDSNIVWWMCDCKRDRDWNVHLFMYWVDVFSVKIPKFYSPILSKLFRFYSSYWKVFLLPLIGQVLNSLFMVVFLFPSDPSPSSEYSLCSRIADYLLLQCFIHLPKVKFWPWLGSLYP